MKKILLNLGLTSLFLSGICLVGCSSGDDSTDNGMNGNDTPSQGTVSGKVPENNDSGKNNNSAPDNIKPDDEGDTDNSGNSGSSDNSGNSGSSDNSGNSGSSDNSGNSGSSDNSGNSGSSDNSGNSGSSDNSGNSGSSDNSGNSGSSDTNWKLIFEDNFESADSIPNPEYWTLTPKGDDTWNRNMSESYGQAYQKDGYLYLFGMESNGEYLTGGIETREKFDFTYGQVKCRARFLRQPQGNHTGIWMMPEPPAEKWPRSGEIDIMEHLDTQDVVYETAHFWNTEKDSADSSEGNAKIDKEEFNVYGVVWDKNSIAFTINGEVKFRYKNNNPSDESFSYQYPFTKPFYLILSQSLGGKGTWEGVIDNDELPAIFQIDWIKVWQK